MSMLLPKVEQPYQSASAAELDKVFDGDLNAATGDEYRSQVTVDDLLRASGKE